MMILTRVNGRRQDVGSKRPLSADEGPAGGAAAGAKRARTPKRYTAFYRGTLLIRNSAPL